MMWRQSKTVNLGVTTIVATIIAVIFLILMEGISSLVLGIYDASHPAATYQQYHETFGWVGQRNATYPDFFGPKKYLKINAQGFREDNETSGLEPRGKLRVICSGNSFTFGQGVANDETWCSQLKSYLPDLDTVNLGQSGYGVDQSYLWYMHAGQHLPHRFHVFAFIGADLDRMAVTSKWDTGKPILRLDGDRIEVENVPVPRLRNWINRKIKAADLRIVELGGKLLTRFFNPAMSRIDNMSHEETKKVARKVFEELVTSSVDVEQTTLFVYLPTKHDLGRDTDWRNWTRSIMTESNHPFIDLTPSMRQLPASEVAKFFISGGDDDGHYTDTGNRWVAEKLSAELAM